MEQIDHPSATDLQILADKFDTIKGNTHVKHLMNAATISQWSSLFLKCGKDVVCRAQLEHLLHHTAQQVVNGPQLHPQGISTILYNLQHIQSSAGTEALLMAVAPHIRRAEQIFGEGLGNGVYGMQNMTPSQGTEAVFRELARHIRHAEQLNEQSIGVSVYGMQNMTPSQGTEAVLLELARHIRHAEQLTEQAIGCCGTGLRNMTPSQGTEAVLLELARHIHHSEQMSGQAISNSVYGLQNMPPTEGTNAVLGALARHIHYAEQLTEQNVGNFLYGLRNMRPGEETRAVLSALLPHVRRIPIIARESISLRFLAEALYSMKLLSSTREARDVIDSLRESQQLPVGGSSLLDEETYRKSLFWLLNTKYHIRSDIKDPTMMVIDLHCLSHGLGEEFCGLALESLLPEYKQLNVVYGSSSHNAANQGKMRNSAERALAKLPFDVQYEFRGAHVQVFMSEASNIHARHQRPNRQSMGPIPPSHLRR